MTTEDFEIKLFTFDCTGCGICRDKCKNNVLKIIDNGMCRFVNVIDEASCIGCGLCEKHCPTNAIKIFRKKELIEQL